MLVHGSHRLEQRQIESSRSRLLETLRGSRDVTFVRSIGNVGDELIWAGTRRLLADVAYREVGIGELDGVSGHTVLLSGGGAWSQPYHELLPEILGALDASFERVVVLPSSFDLQVPSVRRALARTRGVVFAREPVSYRLISQVCRAQLACDCAFFFDFVSYRRDGYGELTAHRADRESPLWGEVYVVDSSGEERLFAAGVEGSQVALAPEARCRYRLYSGTRRERRIAEVGVSTDRPDFEAEDGTLLEVSPGNAGAIVRWRVKRGLPSDNVDISAQSPSLDAWLWTIARHEHIRTDRAHVMIAAAMLDKTVEVRSSSTHKVPAIAQWNFNADVSADSEQ